MSEPTFAQLCEATGKTDAELGALANLSPSTVKNYKARNKPSQALKEVVGRLLAGEPMQAPPQAPPQPQMQPINIDREMVPSDFSDNEDWHFLRVQDSSPEGIERVRADVAQLRAGITQEGARGQKVFCQYEVAHKFSDNFVIMKCPMAQYRAMEEASVAKAAAAWPQNQKAAGDGLSTETKRETRFIEGSAGMPTGEPVAA